MIEKTALAVIVFLVLVNFMAPGLSFALSVLLVYLAIGQWDL